MLRTALAGLLAGLVALLPTPSPALQSSAPWLGAAPALAQGGMDYGILLPSFSDLPLSVQPGQSFPLIVNTAPGTQCVGRVDFRGEPTIELDAQPAPSGTCAWTIDVPQTARPGTAIIGIDFNRGGQDWSLAGVTFVNAIGESR
jgi:hypothetical protein